MKLRSDGPYNNPEAYPLLFTWRAGRENNTTILTTPINNITGLWSEKIDDTEAIVGTNVHYAPYIEFGTK
jgi:phage gpG-like protein